VTGGTSWAEFFATKANVGVTDGALCGEAGIGHVRLMLSTPSHILETIIIAMATALRDAQSK
jgi:cystathionine beta-lyase